MAFKREQITADTLMRIRLVKSLPDDDVEHCEAPESAWVRGFVQYAKDNDSYGADGAQWKRLLAIIGLIFGAGLRRFEVAKILCGDIKARSYKIQGKGSSVHKLPLTDFAIECIMPWKNAFEYLVEGTGADPANMPLICPIGQGGLVRFGECVTPQGLNHIFNQAKHGAVQMGYITDETAPRPHDGRAFFITTVASETGDISAAQQLARHKNISTTQLYDTRAKSRAKKIAREIDMLGGDKGME